MLHDPDDLDLTKFVRLFASEHDGEVVAAVRAATRQLQAHGHSWNDVTVSVGHADPVVYRFERTTTWPCQECGKMFKAVGIGLPGWNEHAPRKYCSPECRKAGSKKTRAATRAKGLKRVRPKD